MSIPAALLTVQLKFPCKSSCLETVKVFVYDASSVSVTVCEVMKSVLLVGSVAPSRIHVMEVAGPPVVRQEREREGMEAVRLVMDGEPVWVGG